MEAAELPHPATPGSVPWPDTAESRSGSELANRVGRRLDLVGYLANGLGAFDLFVFLTFLAPATITSEEFESLTVRGLIAVVNNKGLTLPLGRRMSSRTFKEEIEPWLRSGLDAPVAQREAVLRYPLEYAKTAAMFWAGAAVLFAALCATIEVTLAITVGLTIVLGGVTACAVQFLLVERTLRPVTARALAGGPPPGLGAPGVAHRLSMAWALATGVPLLGIVAFTVSDLAGADLDGDAVVATCLFLAVLGGVIGLWTMMLAAKSVGDSVGGVQRAIERIEAGELGARVVVDDGSEVGKLQAGFNRMAVGLEERERLRDLFGRHVGRDVAAAAFDGGVKLGGEIREVAALFVDLVGSTTMAAKRPPEEVVALLNDFFRIVIEIVEEHRGWVNKFEGDGALCVFGAPITSSDPAGDAMAAARELRDRLRRELPSVQVGIGVSAGPAVAGNVGSEERLEYTVIGDPVNEAARLCDLAKQRPEGLLASDAALAKAAGAEAERWSLGDSVRLRGRDEETQLATVSH